MKVRRLRIRGAPWRIVIGRPPLNKCEGLCVYQTRTIYVRPNSPDRSATAVHEILHACFPDIEEAAIREAEEAIMEGLGLVCP